MTTSFKHSLLRIQLFATTDASVTTFPIFLTNEQTESSCSTGTSCAQVWFQWKREGGRHTMDLVSWCGGHSGASWKTGKVISPISISCDFPENSRRDSYLCLICFIQLGPYSFALFVTCKLFVFQAPPVPLRQSGWKKKNFWKIHHLNLFHFLWSWYYWCVDKNGGLDQEQVGSLGSQITYTDWSMIL
jgi:hypothetical protein